MVWVLVCVNTGEGLVVMVLVFVAIGEDVKLGVGSGVRVAPGLGGTELVGWAVSAGATAAAIVLS
jgi:hypothetical protein